MVTSRLRVDHGYESTQHSPSLHQNLKIIISIQFILIENKKISIYTQNK